MQEEGFQTRAHKRFKGSTKNGWSNRSPNLRTCAMTSRSWSSSFCIAREFAAPSSREWTSARCPRAVLGLDDLP
jgi:hypothetical protein